MIFFGNKSINGRYHLECRDSMAEPLGNWAEGKRNRGHFVILIIVSILIIILIILRIIAILIILKILIGKEEDGQEDTSFPGTGFSSNGLLIIPLTTPLNAPSGLCRSTFSKYRDFLATVCFLRISSIGISSHIYLRWDALIEFQIENCCLLLYIVQVGHSASGRDASLATVLSQSELVGYWQNTG